MGVKHYCDLCHEQREPEQLGELYVLHKEQPEDERQVKFMIPSKDICIWCKEKLKQFLVELSR